MLHMEGFLDPLIQHRLTSTRWKKSFLMDHGRSEENLLRFNNSNPRDHSGSRRKRLSLLSAVGRANFDDSYIISSVPALRDVSIPDKVHSNSDPGNDTEDCECRKPFQEDGKIDDNDLRRSRSITRRDNASSPLNVNDCRLSSRPKKEYK